MSNNKYIVPMFLGSSLLLNILWLNHRTFTKYNLHEFCPIAGNPPQSSSGTPIHIIDILLQKDYIGSTSTIKNITDNEIIQNAITIKTNKLE